jgi:hypothetical protein
MAHQETTMAMSDPVPIAQVQAAATKTLHAIEHTPEGADPHHRTFQTVCFHTTSAPAPKGPSEKSVTMPQQDAAAQGSHGHAVTYTTPTPQKN